MNPHENHHLWSSLTSIDRYQPLSISTGWLMVKPPIFFTMISLLLIIYIYKYIDLLSISVSLFISIIKYVPNSSLFQYPGAAQRGTAQRAEPRAQPCEQRGEGMAIDRNRFGWVGVYIYIYICIYIYIHYLYIMYMYINVCVWMDGWKDGWMYVCD